MKIADAPVYLFAVADLYHKHESAFVYDLVDDAPAVTHIHAPEVIARPSGVHLAGETGAGGGERRDAVEYSVPSGSVSYLADLTVGGGRNLDVVHHGAVSAAVLSEQVGEADSAVSVSFRQCLAGVGGVENIFELFE